MALVQQFFPTFFYNGRPMSGGTINFFKNDDQVTTQPAYSDAGALNPFVTRSIDENGQVTATPQIFLDDALDYYVAVKDSGGVVRYEYFGLPNVAGGGSTTVNYTSENLVPNPQFYQHQRETLTITDGTPLNVAPPNWQFLRSSTAAPNDSIAFMTDLTTAPIGSQAQSTPTYWFEYNKTSAGTAVTEIKLFFEFPTVRALANEAITIKADVYCDNAVSFNFFATQFHGTGSGGGTVNQVLGTSSIAGGEINSWVTKTVSTTVNALAGTIVDSDDYVRFGLDLTGLYALASAEFRITNIQLLLGNDTNNYDWSPVWYDASTSIPTPDPENDDGKVLVVNDSGYYELQELSDININLIWGGDFSANPWQEGTSTTYPNTNNVTDASNSYPADGYKLITADSRASGSKFAITVNKQADAPTLSQAIYYTTDCLKLNINSGALASAAAADIIRIQHVIEGYDWRQVQQQNFTISFWVKSNKIGTYCVALKNSVDDQSYIHEYAISSADTWEKKEFTVPAYPAGTWNYTTGKGLEISWTFLAGTNFQTSTANKDTWGNFNGLYATDAISLTFADTPNNYVQIALPQLHQGDTAVPYSRVEPGEVLQKAQRYFERTVPLGLPAVIGNATQTYSLIADPTYYSGIRQGTLVADSDFLGEDNAGRTRLAGLGSSFKYASGGNESFMAAKRIVPHMYHYGFISVPPGSIRAGHITELANTTNMGANLGFTPHNTFSANQFDWALTTVTTSGVPVVKAGTAGNRVQYHWIADARF